MAIYEYQTEKLTDFSKPENIKLYEEALALVRGYLGEEYPLIINGERVFTDKFITSLNPSNHSEVIGKEMVQTLPRQQEYNREAGMPEPCQVYNSLLWLKHSSSELLFLYLCR